MEDLYARHDRVALMFSGGKDSIACLHLLQDYLDKTALIWVNTGAAFPEIEEFMQGVKQLVPMFIEVRSDQPGSIEERGYPSDVVPIRFTSYGQACTSDQPIKLRSYLECCSENFWVPADQAARDLGVTAIIRGQRKSEAHRSPFQSGDTWQGIEYVFPIEDWSDEQVLRFLEEKGVVLDDRLRMSHSSLDCWNCTAYLADSKDRMQYIKARHPEKYAEVQKLIKQIDAAVTAELSELRSALE